MKYFPKIFIMGTVGSIGISLFLLMLGFESTIAIWILKALIIHALVSVPIIINQKLIGEDKRKFIKTMVIVSTIFLLFGLIFMYIVFPRAGARGGLEVLVNMFLGVTFVFSFTILSFLTSIGVWIYSIIKCKPEKIRYYTYSIIYNVLTPFFSIILFIWSFFLITVTIGVLLGRASVFTGFTVPSDYLIKILRDNLNAEILLIGYSHGRNVGHIALNKMTYLL